MSYPEQLMLSGAAIGAGTGHLIGLGAGDVVAGADTGKPRHNLKKYFLDITLGSLEYPGRQRRGRGNFLR